MADPARLRIGVVATRLGGTDGVSLETDTWARVLRELGHVVECFVGLAQTPLHPCTIVPKAFFGHPDVETITANVFGTDGGDSEPVRQARQRCEVLAAELRRELEHWISGSGLELLIAENTLSLPIHLPLGLAISRLAASTGMPVLAHHHDLPWERSRFKPSAVEDYLEEAFPPRLPNVHHACINSQQRAEIHRRIGRTARVIPNVIELERPPRSADRSRRVRHALGLAAGELLVLQPTRVVPRKGIEHAIELVRRLQRPAALVVTGAAGDEGREHGAHLEALARRDGVHVVWAWERFAAGGASDSGQERFSLDEAFEAADLVTYPSRLEGFGRALLAAARHRRPIVVNRYPIYDRDIRPLGFKAIEMQGDVGETPLAEVRALLDDPRLRAAWADRNERIVRRHFSVDVLRRELPAALAESLGDRAPTRGTSPRARHGGRRAPSDVSSSADRSRSSRRSRPAADRDRP